MISIVVSALNHLHDLTIPCIRAIRRNTTYPYQLIGVDDGSSDGTFEYFSAAADRACRHTRNKGIAAARNTGVRAAGGNYVYFLDNDALVYRGWLRAHVEAHKENPTAIMGDIPSNEIGKLQNPRAPDGLIYVDQIAGCCMCIPKSVFGRIGLFDEALQIGEDTDFCFRARLAGIDVALAPGVILEHDNHGTISDESRESGVRAFREKWAGRTEQFSWR